MVYVLDSKIASSVDGDVHIFLDFKHLFSSASTNSFTSMYRASDVARRNLDILYDTRWCWLQLVFSP